ncbi:MULTISPECIES: phosphoserine phosphatase SerB [Bifidobacterium]|uniref:phosphoserine phosphatase n=1 Tax=Bifidobacterium tibiigranuli TaxID=2172043 RepID=A0A5N6S1T9_9BIFI|nr:phosphoserine phosphatase SerB [Bifidobacterium tibiigranuli]KAE8127177.1 phosphoserine phosphatase SerB [Bifidobacterium tibiigranuli]KAE8127600.1 phosphoserine phosphatase SerB [Bifidobacterium tibiigranuli]
MHEQNSKALNATLDTPTLSRPGLLVMDVDSTLIDEEVIDQLGREAGVGERIADITARTMAGELDFCQALRARVALLKGMDVAVFDTVYATLHFTTGALALIETLHQHGWKVGVVSGGFHETVDRLAQEAQLDHWIANRLAASEGRLTGEVVGDIVCRTTKEQALRTWAQEDGIAAAQTVAVGDGANDIPMIQRAALGVAFCAKPAVREAADAAIDTRDLRLVLGLLRD